MIRGEHSREPIAILGTALRLPGGVSTPERFWEALEKGEELIGTVPPERWNASSFLGADPDEAGTTYDIHGGFISEVDAFDADLFGMHPREASKADPQQRLLLELTWEALERSSINPQSMAGTQTGIWIGISNNDWARMLVEDPRKIDGYTGVGGAGGVAAGRIAHFLGTHGPAEVIDTACSSSLVALHHAVRSLRCGETNLAIVGGANLILSPDLHICFSRSGMLSRSGRCHTFDNAADGYVRSEGCCIVVLKRLADAERDGDPILAVIRGTAVNQDGRSARLTSPNIRAQQKVMRSALENAGVEPGVVSYVEAHGTGTPLGDPMEFLSTGMVYGAHRSASNPLHIGSVKTNLGHCEGAAGLAGLIKVALMLQRGHCIAPHLHCSSPSFRINWKRWPIEVAHTLTPWPKEDDIHFAGISSFGFSGTNAHVILSSVENVSEVVGKVATPSKESYLCISAASVQALRSLAVDYIAFLRKTEESFADICLNALHSRARLTHRLAVRAFDALGAAGWLEQWLGEDKACGVVIGDESAMECAASEESLAKLVAEFLAGQKLQVEVLKPKRIALPTYPFQKHRFWFEEFPEIQWQRQREQTWQEVCAEALRQSQLGPLGWKPESYPERWAALERLTLAYAHNTLFHANAFPERVTNTLSDVMQRCSFLPIYQRLVGRWLRNLAAVGMLVESDGSYISNGKPCIIPVEGIWRDAEKILETEPGLLAYFKRCGVALGDVLTGKVSALETLFPAGSFELAEALYQESPEARYNNAIVANTVRAACKRWGKKRNVRILEIGAGTGGTTSAVAPLLPQNETEYWFTDVSELFLRRARKKFGQFPFIRYRRFDLDAEPEDQDFPTEYFDVVVAANALHTSRDLPLSLSRIRRMLAPGGILALIETTVHQVCFDMSIGLIEGWQHFKDSERVEDPLLSESRWCEVLRESGFKNAISLPEKDSPAFIVGQHVVLAQHDFESSRKYLHSGAESGETRETSRKELPVSATVHALNPGECSEAECAEMVAGIVRQVICTACRLTIPPEDLRDRDRLGDLGMDSLIALELRNELGKALGLEGKLSATVAFDTGTVGELINGLVKLMSSLKGATSSKAPERIYPTDSKTITAGVLQSLTDAEVEELLRERLAQR